MRIGGFAFVFATSSRVSFWFHQANLTTDQDWFVNFGGNQFSIEHPGEANGYFGLSFCQVAAIDIETIRPAVYAAFRINQLHIDLHLVAGPAHAALDDVTDPEVAPDLLHIGRFALVGESGVAGNYEASRNSRKIGGQIVGDAVGEIFLLRVIRQIGERQNDQRQWRRSF